MSTEFKTVLTETPLRVKVAKVVATFLLVGMIAQCFNGNNNRNATPDQYSGPIPYPLTLTLTKEQEDAFGLLINMNGKLCGKILEIVTTAKDQFEVECILYRNGTSKYRYMINMKTGRVA